MKQIKLLALAALLLGGLGFFSSCSEKDTPVITVDPEEKENRDALLTHIGNDSKILADYFNAETFNATTQAYTQLLALIKRDAKFVPGMRTLFSAVSEKKSLLSIYPVSASSELAKMGYLLYINVDNSGFGAQVIFDGKGGCRILGADHLEFIFPATITGIGTTLFKLTVKNSADCYQSVSDANIPNVNMKRVACVSRLPKSIHPSGTAPERKLRLCQLRCWQLQTDWQPERLSERHGCERPRLQPRCRRRPDDPRLWLC